MTLYLAKPSFTDRILKRLGKSRAIYVGSASSTASRKAVKEPFLRALFRKPGQPLPEGWAYWSD